MFRAESAGSTATACAFLLANLLDLAVVFPLTSPRIFWSRSWTGRRKFALVAYGCSCYARICSTNPKESPMEWTTPQHEEIDLNCEISSYANAEI